MTSYNPPQKWTEYIFYVALEDQANPGEFKANPTLAAGDAQVSSDGGAFSNLDTIPAVTPAAGVAVKVTVSATEMNADNVFIQFIDAAGDEWYNLAINLQTTSRQFDDLPTNVEVQAECDTALASYDAPTKTELDNGLAALNDPTAVAIRTEIDSNSTQLAAIVADTNELQVDDVPGLIAALNDPAASAVADAVWDEAQAGHVGAGSFGLYLDTEVSGVGGGSAASIADAVWDETMADHVAAGSTGATLNAITTASAGSGDTEWVYTLTDSVTGSAIAGALVWATSDIGGATGVAAGYTNASGQVTFYLDAGTYYYWRTHPNFTFSDPDTEVIA